MNNQRPINLNLFTIRQPLPAIVSLLHRISGLILFLLIPFLLWGFYLSVSSQQNFDDLQQVFTIPWIKFIIWCCLSAFIYHLMAGIRHLLMDIGIGEELKSGRLSAILTIVITLLLIILTGIWLW